MYTRKKVRNLICVFILGMICCSFMSPLSVSAKESSQKVIKVGYYPSAGFQEYDKKTNTYSGYSYEFLKALEQYGDWRYEFVPCSFSEGLELLKKGKIDIMNNVSRTTQRDQIYDFTSLSTGENVAYLAMKPGDTRVAYDDLEAIEKIRIGLAKDSIYSDRLVTFFQKNNVNADITWFSSHEKLVKAFENDKVDAYVITSSIIKDEHVILSFNPDSYGIATKKGNTELISEIDDAITALRQNDSSFENRLHDKYYEHVTENYTVLTEEENEYISTHPKTTVLYIPDWYPICYSDENGEFAGALRSVYDLLEERTGLKFEYVADDGSDDIMETSGMQIMCEQPTDFSKAEQYGVRLTKSFITTPLMEVSKNVMKQHDTMILVKGDYLSQLVVRKFGDMYQYKYCDTIEQCIEAVKSGKADGTVLISYESEYYRQQSKYSKLRYTIIDVNSYGLSIAVLEDEDPELYSIIQKGLNSISNGEITNIFNQTLYSLQKDTVTGMFYRHPFGFTTGIVILAVVFVSAVLGLYFARKLKRQNEIIFTKNQELQKANSETTNFLSRMSHDMRTPMNGILGMSHLSLEEQDINVLKGNIEKIENSGEYLLNLINDTLDFQKIESGKMELHSKVCNLKNILNSIAEMNKNALEEKNLKFIVTDIGTEEIDYVYLDEVRIKQIFMNLLSNAIKFTPEGGTIEIKHECIGTQGDITHDIFYVSDTGIGMTKEFINQSMFQPFVQEQSEIISQYAGSGLGLSIVYRLVEMMGGTIEVESELGKGTTFIIHMDFKHVDQGRAEQELKKEEKIQSSHLENLQNKRILLVEDHPLNAEITRKLLEKVGCQVFWVDNGQKAIDTFITSEVDAFDAILMDIRMPVMDGLTAAKEIRKLDRKDASKVPIIAMTANAYESDVKNCLDAGMNMHVPKPISVQLLYDALLKCI